MKTLSVMVAILFSLFLSSSSNPSLKPRTIPIMLAKKPNIVSIEDIKNLLLSILVKQKNHKLIIMKQSMKMIIIEIIRIFFMNLEDKLI